MWFELSFLQGGWSCTFSPTNERVNVIIQSAVSAHDSENWMLMMLLDPGPSVSWEEVTTLMD